MKSGAHLIIKVDDLGKELVKVKQVNYKSIYGGIAKRRVEETILLDNGDFKEVREIVGAAFRFTFLDRPGNMEGSNNNIYIIQKK